MLDEFYRIAFRKRLYATIDDLQADLDAWMREFNEARPHQGKWCFGKTPLQTFLDALPLAREKSNQARPSEQIETYTVQGDRVVLPLSVSHRARRQGRHLSLEGLPRPRQGARQCLDQADDAGGRRIQPSLSPPCAAERLPPHPPLRLVRRHGSRPQHRARPPV